MVGQPPCSGRIWEGAQDTNVCWSKEEESVKVQTRNCGTEGNKKVSEVIRNTHTTNAVSETGKGNSSGS